MARESQPTDRLAKDEGGVVCRSSTSALLADEICQAASKLRGQGNFRAAADLLALALDLWETGDRWSEWATLQLALDNVQEAARGFRKAVQLNPRSGLTVANLALVLELEGQYEEADLWANLCSSEVLDRQEKLVDGLLQMVGRRKGAADRFLEDLRTIPNEDPSLAPATLEAIRLTRFDSGYFVERCLERISKLRGRVFRKVLEGLEIKGEGDYRFYVVLGRCHMQLGDYEKGLRFLHLACERNSSDLYAENTLIACSRREAEKTGIPSCFDGLEVYLAGSFCERPFRQLEISLGGNTFLCCPGWLPVRIGHPRSQPLDEIWNSAFAIEIRKSILDGSFRYCSKIHCPQIAGRTLQRKGEGNSTERDAPSTSTSAGPQDAMSGRLEHGPRKLVLAYDRTCNLACPQCRKGFHVAGREEQEAMERDYLPLILRAAQDAEAVYLDGAGEALASKHCRYLLSLLKREQFPHLKLWLVSNGQLMNETAFREFDLSGRVEWIHISVDAARAETYRVVRRGGDFERVLTNLAFLDELRSVRGEKFKFEMGFVATSLNFRDIPEFVQLGKRFHADSVLFSVTRNFGHLSPAEFEKLNIAASSHPEHEEFLKVLDSPELDDPIADCGSVGPYRRRKSQRP